MTRALEQRYRQALRWYPKRWRVRNADAAIGTLLELAHDDGRSTPAAGELANLRFSGLSARAGFIGRIVPAAVRDRSAPIALALGGAIAAGGILSELADEQRLIHNLAFFPSGNADRILVAGPFANLGVIFFAVWIVALVLAAVGLQHAAKIALAVSLPLSVLTPKASEWFGFFLHPLAGTVGWLDLLALIALAGALRQPGSRRVLLVWFGVFAAALASLYAASVAQQWGVFPRVDWYVTGFAQVLVFPGILLAIAAAVILWRRAHSPWAPAILILTAPLLPLAILDATYDSGWFDRSSLPITVVVVIAAVVGLMALFDIRLNFRRAR
jgi:hypothetical protein